MYVPYHLCTEDSADDRPLDEYRAKFTSSYQPSSTLMALLKAWAKHLGSVHGGSKSEKSIQYVTHHLERISSSVGGLNCTLSILLDKDRVYSKFFKLDLEERASDPSKGLSCNTLTAYTYSFEQFLIFCEGFLHDHISDERKNQLKVSLKAIQSWRDCWKKEKRKQNDQRQWKSIQTLVTPAEIEMKHSQHVSELQVACDTSAIARPMFFTCLEIRNWLIFSINVENFNRAGICSTMTLAGKHSILNLISFILLK